MGDRKNHDIKFGPDWLRNMSPPEQSATRSSASSSGQGVQRRGSPAEPGGTGGQAPRASTTPTPTMSTNARNTRQSRPRTPKRRYGREELLSFCERSGDPPDELKSFDLLYQARQKKPVALSYGEEEVRGNPRGGPTIGTLPTERFGGGRSVGRTTVHSETRGRTRTPFVRHAVGQSVGRGNGTPLHTANVRSAGFSISPDEEGAAVRPWSASNGGVPANRPGEQGEWSQNKMFRRRPNNLTNWRQTSRDEGDEWRNNPENNGRPRTHLDKWDRDWNDNERRPTQERQWGNNRRTWAGNDAQNEDNLPEWAMDNAEARAGTFDASGAFHGYTNDDSNIPQPQESNYALSRSHTHGGFSRANRGFEEGSEEWWASEKANKLSPKRFDTGENTSKMTSNSSASDEQSNTNAATLQNEAASLANIPEKPLESNPQPSTSKEPMEDQTKSLGQQFPDSKPFGATLRSNKGFETNDESGNFQSVMLNQNNSLRQQHQNITSSNNDQQTHSTRALYDLIHGFPMNSDGNPISEFDAQQNILDELVGLTLTEDEPLVTAMNVQTAPKTKNTHQPLQMQQTSNNAAGLVPNMPAPNMPVPNMPTSNMPTPNMQAPNMQAPNMQVPNMQAPNMQAPNMQAPNMQAPNMATPNMVTHNITTPNVQMGISSDGMDSQNMTRNAAITVSMTTGMNPSLIPGLTTGITHGLAPGLAPGLSGMNSVPVQVSVRESTSLPTIGVQNPALNSALGLSRMRSVGMPVDATLPPLLQTQPMNSSGPPMHSRRVMGPFQATDNLQTMPLNNSLFMERANAPLQQPIPTTSNPIQNAQNPYPIGMQRNVNETLDLVYESILQQHNHNIHNVDLTNQWYYKDPNEVVRGPFTSSQMMYWYDAGFFSPALMVRRACEAHLRPLGSYGPLVPFAFNMELPPMLPPQYEQRRAPPELMNRPVPENLHENLEALWSGTGAPQVWPQQRPANYRGEDAVNNLPPFFWNGPNANMMNLPVDIVKGMKTEDQILAQMRAKQNTAPPENIPFLNCRSPTTTSSSANISTSDDSFNVRATPELEKLQQLLQSDTQTSTSESKSESEESETKCEKLQKTEIPADPEVGKTQSTVKLSSETKSAKQAKSEPEKPTKTKDSNNGTKTKNKKNKDDKKDETEAKMKEEEIKPERASVETSPTKSKKEEKLSKKEIEKEKKEWIKEGFTIVKGAEKNNNKEKKKMEEAKMLEELELKMKEEKLSSEEEKKKKPTDLVNKKEMDQQQQRQISDSLAKRAPWSVSTQSVTSNKGGLTLSEIQRLEREKKLEQIKEQQHMMHLIAQQQAAALAREQEMQANLAWAKNNLANNGTGPSLAEIQAETRRQSAAAAAAATQSIEEVIPLPPLPTNLVPWSTSTNGGGFWDTQSAPSKPEKPEEPVKPVKPSEPKSKKKVTVPTAPTNPTIPKREPSPTSEFEAWCSTVLALWRTKIDVPTFVGFLKDIESPYEVKDYVKCYLGDSKDSSDFARQFLERRSKLLRVGMVTPSDDLCSPAMAINPRSPISDYQEVKGKGKKSKKNKMLKVDARILGFSVTASEDRINVGDIDTV